MGDKAEIRARLRKERDSLSIIEMAELSARACENVLAMPEYQRARHIMCYANIHNELATHGLIRRALEGGKCVYLPVVRANGTMDAARVTDLKTLVRSSFGVPEPVDGEVVDPAALELVLVPGVAFDKNGGRLGYGAGYYDRYLPLCRCPRFGLCYELQLTEALPLAEGDAPMDGVITEKAIYDCRIGRNRAR